MLLSRAHCVPTKIQSINFTIIRLIGDGCAWKGGAIGPSIEPKISANEMERVWEIFPCHQSPHLYGVLVIRHNVCIASDAKSQLHWRKISSSATQYHSSTHGNFESLQFNCLWLQWNLKLVCQFQTQPLKSGHAYSNDYVRHQFVDGPIRVTTLILASSLAIIIYIVLSTLREFLQIYQQKWQYLFEPNNLISWLLYISGAIMVSPVFNGGQISDVHFSATAITVFLSWFNLLLFLQRFDQVKQWYCMHSVKMVQRSDIFLIFFFWIF